MGQNLTENYSLTVNQPELEKILDWAVSKFYIADGWEDRTLVIALPDSNKETGQGFIKIHCNERNWTIEVDKAFEFELGYILS